MLNIIKGRAGTGKTNYIISEIRQKMQSGETDMILLVPEQYSHEAERQLCKECGDSLSLHAEVLSFTGLSRRVQAEVGKREAPMLDSGGQILLMHRAIEAVAPSLKVFGIKKMRAEIPKRLLETIIEFKTRKLTPKMLEKAAATMGKPLAEKIQDFALIFDAYKAMQKTHGGDAIERLEMLAENIAESSVGTKGTIYFDGFNDFTAQELSIIEELIKKEANITICLTLDETDESEIFTLPSETEKALKRMAKNAKTLKPEEVISQRAPELKHMEKHLFTEEQKQYTQNPTDDNHSPVGATVPVARSTRTHHTNPTDDSRPLVGDDGNRPTTPVPLLCDRSAPIKIYAAKTRYEECSYAAATVRKLINEGYRWRDIAVMSRDWKEYSSVCENVFEKYGIPYFSGVKSDISSKPAVALILAALEVSTLGYEFDSVFKLLKTDLFDVTRDEISLLENYVSTWQIRSYYWQKEWKMPPLGYGREGKDDVKVLGQINNLRKKIIKPLDTLKKEIKGEAELTTKLKALYDFLIEISFPEKLAEKSKVLSARGEERLADEYTRLLSIIMSALDQMHLIIGDQVVNEHEFKKLLTLVIAEQDVGAIPLSLDSVPLGSMAMSRRRNLKALIILGVTDDKLPLLTKTSGALSESERLELSKILPDIPAGLEDRYKREMNMLYSTLTLPSEKLYFTYPSSEGKRRSLIVTNICKMFDLQEEILSEEEYMSYAKIPYEELLMKNDQKSTIPEREKLSEQVAKSIYGEKIALSATRADRYYSCPYKHFLQNGLALSSRAPAEFDAASAGNFIHAVLDGVFKEIKENGEFKDVNETELKDLTEKHCKKFVSEVLLDFEGKTARFKHLFKRFEEDVYYIVDDMANELKTSKFTPLNLELDISQLDDSQKGFIDRVDGYEHDGKLYLRVIDYKTKKKAYSFELSEVLRGKDMQMLIYLSALQKYGEKFYEKGEIQSSGVLYVPARDVLLNTPRNTPQEEIDAKRVANMRRSGLVLNDPEIIEAMESGENKRYLPVEKSRKKDANDELGKSFVSKERIEKLFRHVDNMMQSAKEEILNGVIDCKPYYKNETENACTYCDYKQICAFDETEGDKRKHAPKLKPEEVWSQL